jgi:O-antigen/teichoic acid export membrane protein
MTDGFTDGSDTTPSLSRSGFDAFLTSGTILALGLLSTLAVARGLGPSGKGRFDLLVATGAMLSLFLGLHLPTGITYVVARGNARLETLERDMALFAVAEGAVAALILWAAWLAFGSEWGSASNGWASPLVLGALVVAFVVLSAVASLWRGVLIGRQQIIRANRRDLVVRSIQVGLVVIVVVVGASLGREIEPGIVYAVTVAAALAAALIFVRSVTDMPRAKVPLPEGEGAFREAVRFALPTYLGNVVQMANYRLDLFFIAFFVGAAQVGIYSIAVVLSQLVWLVPRAVALVLLPSTAAAQDDVGKNSDRAAMGARVALWGGAGACLALAGVASWAIPLVFGTDFSDSSALLLWLLPGVWLLSPAVVMASFVAGVGKPSLNLMVWAAGFVVTVGLDLVLIPGRGATGAAIASTAAYSFSAILMAVVFVRLSTAGFADVLIPRKSDATAVIRAARSAIARRDVVA